MHTEDKMENCRVLERRPVPHCNELSEKCHSIPAFFFSLHTATSGSVDESASVLQLCVRLLILQLQAPPFLLLIGHPGIVGVTKALHCCCVVSPEARASHRYNDAPIHTVNIYVWRGNILYSATLHSLSVSGNNGAVEYWKHKQTQITNLLLQSN